MFEGDDFLFGHGVGFGDDGDEIDLGMKPSHEFYVHRFQSARSKGSAERPAIRERRDERVTGGFDKVETGVDSVVDDLGSVDSVLLFEVGVESCFDVVEDWLPSAA